ncbi:hypothetical protein ACM66B_000503 [Microbotryomycetes sp. NB124-2]
MAPEASEQSGASETSPAAREDSVDGGSARSSSDALTALVTHPNTEKRRVPRPRVSCGFCRRRKLKCDLEVPCSSCLAHGEVCEPLERSKKPRPTHQRIEELEAERNALQSFINKLASSSRDQQAVELGQWQQSHRVPTDLAAPSSSSAISPALSVTNSAPPAPSIENVDRTVSGPVSRLHIRDGHATSHGPTSAFFDESEAASSAAVAPLSDAEIKSRLMTFCAEQRHQEMIALALGNLDFDGVQPELAMHLLALHWNRQHHAFLITYRPLFMRDMAGGGPYFSKLLLNAIYFSVAKFSKRPEVFDDVNDPRTAGLRFLRRVKELLGESLDKSRIPTIQALLLLSSSLFALGWQSAPWVYSGIAFRMLSDLGLLHDWRSRVVQGGDFEPADLEIRRRLVWAAFVFDKIISLYQGRAVTLHEFDVKVPPVFYDMFEEGEVWTPFAFPSTGSYTSSPSYSVSTFTELCSLSVLMGRIINTFYAEHSCPDPLQQLAAHNKSLAEWSDRLPACLRYDPSNAAVPVPPPHVLSLYSIYYTLTVLVNRPFLESGHLQTGQVAGECWSRCEFAAKKATAILTRYRETYTLSRAPYLIAYGTYIAATIMVRTAAQQGPTSDAARCLKVCMDGLKENADVNTGARKTLAIIESLVKRLNVAVSEDGVAATQTPTDDLALPSQAAPSVDIDAIMSSFNFNQDMWTVPAYNNLAPVPSNGFQQDSLFGISLLSWPDPSNAVPNESW